MVEVLLKYGASTSLGGVFEKLTIDKNIILSMTEKNATPMEVACAHGRAAVVQLLIKHETAELSTAKLSRAFLWACEGGHVAIVKVLLELGVHNANALR